MTGVRRMMAVVIGMGCCAVLYSAALSSQPATAVGQPERCELKIEGHSILSLTLVGKSVVPGNEVASLSGQRYARPGKNLWLPAGWYRVEGVELEGGYTAYQRFGNDQQWFELVPGKPYQLVIGAPLSSQVTVKRHGKFLQMDYDLVDGAGRSYSYVSDEGPRPPPPRFSVLKNGQQIGAGSFAYG